MDFIQITDIFYRREIVQDKVNEKMLFELAEKLSVCPEDAMIVQYLNDINRDIQKTSGFSDKIYQEK